MSHPEIVKSSLDGEQVAAEVSLGGEDRLFVTPRRTLIYRGEGLLSDESVSEYPHDAERVDVKQKRRKAEIVLDYGLDGTRSFAVPNDRVDDALHPVLAGVLSAANVTEPGETVKQTYRFSELTVVVTSQRLIKHIGTAVWDDEFRSFPYEDVTALDFEEGSVATQVVLETNGRPERIKAPNQQARDLRERLERALFDYHDVSSYAEFEAIVGDEEDEDDDPATATEVAFDDAIDPLDTGSFGEDEPPETTTETAPDASTEARAGASDESSPNQRDTGAVAGGETTAGDIAGSDGKPATDGQPATGEQPVAGEQPAPDRSPEPDSPPKSDRSPEPDSPPKSDRSPEPDKQQTAGSSDEMSAVDVLGDELLGGGANSEPTASESAEQGASEGAVADEEPSSVPPVETTEDQDRSEDSRVEERLDELTETVERQTEAIDRQRRTIEKLIEELSRGR